MAGRPVRRRGEGGEGGDPGKEQEGRLQAVGEPEGEEACVGWASLSLGGPCPRPTMNLEGLEMVAVLVVLALFVKVLEQFGLFEPVSLEGNAGIWARLVCWLEGWGLYD